MSNPRWSSSRLSTFNDCVLKYKNQYINEIIQIGGKEVAVQRKGLDFHQIAEWMESIHDLNDLKKYAANYLKDATYDTEKYNVAKSMPRFYRFWETQVMMREALGWTYAKEGWQNFTIKNGNKDLGPFVGAIDLALYGPNGEVFIIDYKSGSSAKISDDYARQLMIYALAIGQKKGYDNAVIAEKIKLALFFPLAGLKDEEDTDSKVCEKAVLKNLKTLEYTKEDLEKTIQEINDIIDKSEDTDWKSITGNDGKLSYSCSYCPFIGSIQSQSKLKEFTPCDASYKAGLRSQRGIKFVKKQ
jgi:hypothetical protein